MKIKKEKEMKRGKEETEKEKAWNDTRQLMESYSELKRYIENAVTEETEINPDKYRQYERLKGENAELKSIKESKAQTAMMIINIERAMEEVKEEYTEKGLLYKYEAFKMRYVDKKTLEDIAEKLNCGKNSPANWIKEINRKMAVKLYGVKAL